MQAFSDGVFAFAAIVSLWAIHREFFARYPLGDHVSMVINAVLLFIVLIYVYPLKLLAEIAAHKFLRVGTPTASDMTPAQVQGVYIIFGLAVLLTCLAIAALHLRAGSCATSFNSTTKHRRTSSPAGGATWESG